MKRFLRTGIAAALILALTGAAQEQRFRYLGRIGDFALMSTEANGPQTERAMTAILANRVASGPEGTDNAVWNVKRDCARRRLMLTDVRAYLGAALIRERHGGDSWSSLEIRPGTANNELLRYACTGEANEAEAQWIVGDEAARAFALARAHENKP